MLACVHISQHHIILKQPNQNHRNPHLLSYTPIPSHHLCIIRKNCTNLMKNFTFSQTIVATFLRDIFLAKGNFCLTMRAYHPNIYDWQSLILILLILSAQMTHNHWLDSCPLFLLHCHIDSIDMLLPRQTLFTRSNPSSCCLFTS